MRLNSEDIWSPVDAGLRSLVELREPLTASGWRRATTPTMSPLHVRWRPRWTTSVRGDVYRLRAPKDARGHEQSGSRYAVVVQSDDLPLST